MMVTTINRTMLDQITVATTTRIKATKMMVVAVVLEMTIRMMVAVVVLTTTTMVVAGLETVKIVAAKVKIS